jgi:hypothetical protein
MGTNVQYDPTRSPIANIFDISTLDPREHFLQPIILAHLRAPGVESSRDGFIAVGDLYDRVQPAGFTPEQIDIAIVRTFNKRLVETAARRIPEPGKNDSCALRLTSVGLYHLRELIETFTYLDAVVVDTPILEKETRGRIKDVHTLEDRLERCMEFLSYLDQCWGALAATNPPFDWPEHSKRVVDLVQRLLRRVEDQRNFNFLA